MKWSPPWTDDAQIYKTISKGLRQSQTFTSVGENQHIDPYCIEQSLSKSATVWKVTRVWTYLFAAHQRTTSLGLCCRREWNRICELLGALRITPCIFIGNVCVYSDRRTIRLHPNVTYTRTRYASLRSNMHIRIFIGLWKRSACVHSDRHKTVCVSFFGFYDAQTE